jgi:hypothetical protein
MMTSSEKGVEATSNLRTAPGMRREAGETPVALLRRAS